MRKSYMSGIFISYRRADSAGQAGRLFDRLSSQFGEDQVFMDVSGIELGDDFLETITDTLQRCDVVLVLVGKQWATIVNDDGVRRLDHPGDVVRFEVTEAIRLQKTIIPVLLQGVEMPKAETLPEQIREFTRRNGFYISDDRFKVDADLLISKLERLLPPYQRYALITPDNCASLTKVGQLVGHNGTVQDIAFHPDGHILGSVGDDGKLHIWDMYTEKAMTSIAAHKARARAVAFAPDGSSIATCSNDTSIHIWSVESFERINTLATGLDQKYSVVISPDGLLLCSGTIEAGILVCVVRLENWTPRKESKIEG